MMTDRPIKILAVEDNDFDFELVSRKLKMSGLQYVLKRVFTEEDFRTFLNQFLPDLILSDFSIPSFSGLEALKIARQSAPDTPFIFVSGTIGEELAVETLKQGAIDYVSKENLNKLEYAIKRALDETKEKNRRQQAESQLQIKVNELKTLVYRISHDIRSPVCTIKGLINLIGMTPDQPQGKINEYLGLTSQVVSKLEGIILNLGSCQFVYDDEIIPVNINLKEFASKLKEKVSEINGFDDIVFELLTKGMEQILCEANLLMSICYNLIHNSIVFSDLSKNSRIVKCFIESLDNGVNIIVEDNGIGIPEFIKDKVYEMFFRGNNASKGAGLGLFITKAILEKLGGEIKMESKEGTGTYIHVFIPCDSRIDIAG